MRYVMSYEYVAFNKDNLDLYLRELAKEFRKLNGKMMPAEIILVGGASVLANYGFRNTTYDMDAVILASSAMKEAINHISDKFNLPNSWLNTDFMKTSSYSYKIIEKSVYYKTFSNILTVRTVSGEYLIAMKLISVRKYKNDLSDIVGILMSHVENGNPISLDMIQSAVIDLYGSWNVISSYAVEFINSVFLKSDYKEIYHKIRNDEIKNKELLIEFEKEYPGVIEEQNIDNILKNAEMKMNEEESNPEQLM